MTRGISRRGSPPPVSPAPSAASRLRSAGPGSPSPARTVTLSLAAGAIWTLRASFLCFISLHFPMGSFSPDYTFKSYTATPTPAPPGTSLLTKPTSFCSKFRKRISWETLNSASVSLFFGQKIPAVQSRSVVHEPSTFPCTHLHTYVDCRGSEHRPLLGIAGDTCQETKHSMCETLMESVDTTKEDQFEQDPYRKRL